jgi:murein DD-endopeptidase MepM/ murein hydrolase activator NlpD
VQPVQAVQPVHAVQPVRDSLPQLGALVAPVTGAAVGAGFGQAGSYWAHLHTGLDLEAATGAPVVAVGKGVITSAGWAGAYGYRVVETLPDGTELWYCHLSAIGVGAGEVTAGQPIGRVGATGNVTGPHLHLEVRPGGGEPVDPANWLAEHGLRID